MLPARLVPQAPPELPVTRSCVEPPRAQSPGRLWRIPLKPASIRVYLRPFISAGRLLQDHPQLVEQETPNVHLLFNDLGERLAGAMSGFRFQA